MDGNLSFNTAQLPSLKVLLETVSGRKVSMPTRHKFMSTLDAEVQKVKAELRKRISQQKYVCITADAWSSRAQSYLGVTCHFINERFERESYLLAFQQMKQRQTYDILAKTMHDIFNDYQIEISQITNIVTDGGSNFCKMFKMFGDSIDVVTMNTDGEEIELDEDENNEIVYDSEPESNVASNTEFDVVQEYMLDQNGEEFVNEILTFDTESSLETGTSSNSQTDINELNFDSDYQGYFDENSSTTPAQPQTCPIKLPAQRRCVSHLLNQLGDDFEKNLDGLAKTAFQKTFNALHSLWVIVKVSPRAKQICREVLNATLMFPGTTRWNAKYDCIRQCNKPAIQSKLNELVQSLKRSLTSTTAMQIRPFTSNDFIVMAQYEKVFEPVAQALDTLQGEYNNSQGRILPVLLSMRKRISSIEETGNIIRDFKAVTLKQIDVRFGKYLEYNSLNKDFILSAITLPRYKTNFISSDENKIFAKNLLVSECKRLCDESQDSSADVPEDSCTAIDDDDDFVILFPTNRNTRRNSIDNQIEVEVTQYLLDPRKDVNILNDYRYIRAVFYKYNTTLSSSAPVERVFSQSLMIFTPRRNRISAKNFENTLILKHNRMLIDKQFFKKVDRRSTGL